MSLGRGLPGCVIALAASSLDMLGLGRLGGIGIGTAAIILVFENVAVVHEGMVPRGGSVKGDQKVGAVLNENHVLPPRKMRWRWRIRE